MFFVLCTLSQIAEAQDSPPAAYQPPLFRNAEEQARPKLPDNLSVKLVADADFAPYSFLSRTGSPAGISVEIAIAACEQARLACSVEVKPFAEILPALQRGEADVAVTGPRLDEKTLSAARMTRPYFRIMGRFATANTSTLDTASASALYGRRIGVVKDTVHANWLTTYYSSSRISTYADLAAAGAAHVVNIKLMKSGILAALELAHAARAAGLGLMIGGNVESILAMSVSACFAAGLGGFEFADLDTPLFMATNPFDGGFSLTGGRISVAHLAAGHGTQPRA